MELKFCKRLQVSGLQLNLSEYLTTSEELADIKDFSKIVPDTLDLILDFIRIFAVPFRVSILKGFNETLERIATEESVVTER